MRRLLAILFLMLPLAIQAAPRAGDEEKSTGADPYLAFEPFVVNVQDGARLRFMQVKVQLFSNNSQVLEILKQNTPAMRDAMIMLLAHQEAETMKTVEGREALRGQVLAAAQEVFAKVTGTDPKTQTTPAVEAIYFTDFIIQ